MSERELIETALSVPRQIRLSVDTEVIEDAARQYLASLDAPAPSEREEKLEEALERIEQWSRAYPLDIFPEPDWKKARLLLEEGGMTLDSISAHCMRHVVEGVGKIAQEALSGSTLEPQYRTSPVTQDEMDDCYCNSGSASPVPIIDEMDPRHVSNPGTGAHVLDHRSPPVPQEGVCPTREPRSARDALEEMFDGDIQQADRILSRLAEEGFVVVPKEPTLADRVRANKKRPPPALKLREG